MDQESEADKCRLECNDLLAQAAKIKNPAERSKLLTRALDWHRRALAAQEAESRNAR